MTYRELLYKATRLIDNSKITLGEYDEMTKPLDREVEHDFCEDYIDRSEVMTEIQLNAKRYSLAKECGGLGQVVWSDNLISINDVLDVIRALPPATPTYKTGHWIFQKIIHGKRMRCSNCDSAFDLCCNQIKQYDTSTKRDYLWFYCPWCGARMSEVSEDGSN